MTGAAWRIENVAYFLRTKVKKNGAPGGFKPQSPE